MEKKYVFLAIFFVISIFCSRTLDAQTIETIAGIGVSGGGGDNGPATSATIGAPDGCTFDGLGNFYFTTVGNEKVRKITPYGVISTIAGTGVAGYNGDNILATIAQLNTATGIAVDKHGNVYIADGQNNRVRKIDVTTGIISTIAGGSTNGFGGDNGPATAAMLYGPQDICFDRFGNLYISDENNQRIRRIDTAGIITTVVGNGTYGYNGDNGPATAAEISLISGICFDTIGNLYIAQSGNYVIRKISTTGIITTIAGNGSPGNTGDEGAATAASLTVVRLAINNSGYIYISGNGGYVVRMVDNNSIIHTVVGTGVNGFSGDNGPATAAQISAPYGIAIDACGNLYISDKGNHRIRKVTYPPVLTIPTITLSGTPSAHIGTTVTITATVANAGSSYLIHWLNKGIEFTTTTVPSVTYTKAAGIDTITARVASTASYGCYDSTTSAPVIVMVSTEGVTSPVLSKGEVLAIYPNPVNDVLHISLTPALSKGEGAAAYKIMSIVGAVMQQGNLKEGSNNISIQSLSKGIYIVEITNSEQQRTIKKIIRQ